MKINSDAGQGNAPDEELARSELYGLLSVLYYAPPSAELLAQLQVAVTDAPVTGALLEGPWRTLVGLARQMSLASIESEYNLLFGGIGKPEIYLYGSHFLSGFLNEKPLAKLRTDLAGLDLARSQAMSETEDHLAYLCEVMRYLIASDGPFDSRLTRQRQFFASHLQPWVAQLCGAIESHPLARFYLALAALTRSFMDVEAQSFDMLE
jgi:TorA maturation chaperone TorD